MVLRSSTRRSIPSCAPASTPNSRSRVPATQKKAEAVAAFQRQATERLQAAIPATNTRPIRVFAQDESRFGLRTIRRRRLTARGVQPVGLMQHDFHNFYVYGAVAPTTGQDFFLELPELNSTNFQVFLDAFAATYADTLNLVVLDNSRCHTAKAVRVPDNVQLVF